MPKGGYGFSLMTTETSRRYQLLLLLASPKYFLENAFVLSIGLTKTILNLAERIDLTLTRRK